jgi:hypothetical protein
VCPVWATKKIHPHGSPAHFMLIFCTAFAARAALWGSKIIITYPVHCLCLY